MTLRINTWSILGQYFRSREGMFGYWMESGLRFKRRVEGQKGVPKMASLDHDSSCGVKPGEPSQDNYCKDSCRSNVSACILGHMEIDLQAHTCTHFGAAVSQNADLKFSWWCQTTIIALIAAYYGVLVGPESSPTIQLPDWCIAKLPLLEKSCGISEL